MKYKLSGHETFALRFTWLSKLAIGLQQNPRILFNIDEAIVSFGVGKNMVSAIKFWGMNTNVIENVENCSKLTEFGQHVFGKEGFDPYIEDNHTLWLLHWNLCHSEPPLFIWDFLINKYNEPTFSTESAYSFLQCELERIQKFSNSSLRKAISVFVRTYLTVSKSKRQGKEVENELDCPLNSLDFIEHVGNEGKSNEPIFAFRRGPKPEISDFLFLYCLIDYWKLKSPNETTISLNQICNGHGSPGQIFKMSENEIIERLEKITSITNSNFEFSTSTMLQTFSRNIDLTDVKPLKLLESVYEGKWFV